MVEINLQIRIAEPADGAALAAIYAPYVENTAVTFEYTAPGPDAFRERMENIRRQYPYIPPPFIPFPSLPAETLRALGF